jgi:hypothetical protein
VTDIYNNRTYLLNNPTWHEEDSFNKAKKIAELLKKSALTFQQFAKLVVAQAKYCTIVLAIPFNQKIYGF